MSATEKAPAGPTDAPDSDFVVNQLVRRLHVEVAVRTTFAGENGRTVTVDPPSP